VAHQSRDVYARRYRLNGTPIAGEGVISEVLLLAEQIERLADTFLKAQGWGGYAAIPDDQCGDALTYLGCHVRLGDTNQVVVGVGVNESWRYDTPCYVNDAIRPDVDQVSDSDDGICARGNICRKGRPAAAVNDQSAFQYEVGAEYVCCQVRFAKCCRFFRRTF
jgi:hypothetical protein